METRLRAAPDGPSLSSSHAQEPRGAFGRCSRRMMASYGREVCFVLAAVFTAFAALHNSPLKTQKASIPKRFFPWNSFVHDYYLGNIQDAFEWVLESDLTFVMFYAPWDASSIDTRWEFEKTSKYFHHQVRFLAINCWWPEGQCRQHFKPIQAYPVLMAFPGSGHGIQYRGPRSALHMMHFLESLMQPLKSVFTLEQLIHLQARYDTVVVGYFDFKHSLHPKGFTSFHNAAMKILEKHPAGGVCFAVISSPQIAFNLGLKSSKSVKLFHFNESLEFSKDSLFRSDIILDWILKNHHPTVEWLTPLQVKSLTLSAVLEMSTPVLIMFTPRNPLGPASYFDLLHEIAMDYNNCHRSKAVEAIIQESIVLRKQSQSNYQTMKENCYSLPEESVEYNNENDLGRDNLTFSSCCKSLIVPSILIEINKKSFMCIYEKITQKKTFTNQCKILEQLDLHWLRINRKKLIRPNDDLCFEFSPFYSPLLILLVCSQTSDFSPYKKLFHHSNKKNGKMAVNENGYTGHDDKMISFFEEKERLQCQRFQIANKYSEMVFPVESSNEMLESFTGLGCKTNRTLKFMALDIMQYETFASHLGLNISRFHDKTAILLHNTQQEVQHLLKQMVSKHEIMEFIQNYISGNLNRHLRSSMTANRTCNSTAGEVCVHEITTTSFLSLVLDNTKDVVLLYYAPWCGFCTGLSHIYLTVAQYFQPLHDSLIFARINGDWNDLSWEYTVEEYPTILFFPSFRKSESLVFPGDLPITVANLVHFILLNIGETHRLHMALSLCTSTCIAFNRRRIVSQLQLLIHELRMLLSRHYHVQRAVLSMDARALCKNPQTCQRRKDNLNYYKLLLVEQIKQTRIRLHHSRLLQYFFISSKKQISDTHKKAILDNYEIFKSSIWLNSENNQIYSLSNYSELFIHSLKDKSVLRTSQNVNFQPS